MEIEDDAEDGDDELRYGVQYDWKRPAPLITPSICLNAKALTHRHLPCPAVASACWALGHSW